MDAPRYTRIDPHTRPLVLCGLLLLAGSSAALADSRFNDVQAVVFGMPKTAESPVEQAELAVYAAGQLPQYPVTASRMVVGGVNLLRRDAERTLRDTVDFYPRLEKLVHANGICLAGRWQIDSATPYTGYFKQGAEGLWLGRASVSLSETKRGQPRGFAMAGKLFPTLDPTKTVPTASFFLADVLSGTQREHYLQTAMTNQPKIGFRFAAIPLMFQVSRAFSGLDKQAGYRPVDNIAALGEPVAGSAIRAPKFLMLRPSPNNPLNDAVDFRDELNLSKAHAPAWQWQIWVSDQASSPTDEGWQKIGQITANQSIVSYGCDRQLHFAHPRIAPK